MNEALLGVFRILDIWVKIKKINKQFRGKLMG